eukprot:523184_1
MDSLHFYFFHCYDVGIRSKKQDEMHDEEEKNQDEFFDALFSRKNNLIAQRAHITKHFDRFSTKKNGKFNIETPHGEQMENNTDNTTYLDALYQYLQSKNIEQNDIEQLCIFIKEQEYDTDTIGYDVDLINGNIVKNADSHDCIQKIQHFMQTAKVSSTSFAIGLRFYYWDYYKQRKQLDMDEQEVRGINNYNSHSGYSICDLFIIPRHGSFKEE